MPASLQEHPRPGHFCFTAEQEPSPWNPAMPPALRSLPGQQHRKPPSQRYCYSSMHSGIRIPVRGFIRLRLSLFFVTSQHSWQNTTTSYPSNLADSLNDLLDAPPAEKGHSLRVWEQPSVATAEHQGAWRSTSHAAIALDVPASGRKAIRDSV